MPYPRWLAKINKRLVNPREVTKGVRPVVIHRGRSSGTIYRTPLDAHPTKAGFVLVVRYGPASDWVQNILATGTAVLRLSGEEIQMGSPRLVSQQEAVDELAPEVELDADFLRAGHYLLMDRSD